MNLLLAEPTKAIGNLISLICETEGVDCHVAHDSERLFSLLEEMSFDLICLAPTIDDQNGIGVLQKIRQIKSLAFIPIFLLTSSPDAKFIRQALSSGATDIVNKSDFESLSFFLRRYREEKEPLNAKVLVVEDSVCQQEIFSSILGSIGCKVDFFDCADEAFDSLQSKNYDLVVTDIILKGIFSGIALAGRIRRVESVIGDIPILAVTGYKEPSREVSLFRYGINDYFQKPLNEDRFCRQVRNLVKSYKQLKQLKEKTTELVESDKRRIQFWANLSHEIRTPLNGIIGSMQLINNEDIAEDKQVYIEAVNSSSEMLLSLINDVLDLTRAESGELRFSPKNINLKSTLNQDVIMVKGLADEKGLKLSCDVDPKIPELIECDIVRLNQVMVNLLHNAIKFTAEGGVKVSCEIKEDTNQILEFCVEDSGIGISLSDQGNIFTKYKQANDSVEESYGGTGLGLHIAKLIVSMWGGEIKVDSLPGKGSRFYFTMPLRQARNLSENGEMQLVFADPENKKILVVDDSSVNLMIVKALLRKLGISADSANSAAGALEKIKEKDYDCVFMDCQMPEMNGLQATELIRSDVGKNKRVPVIALTAFSSIEFRKECQQAGMSDFLEKPLKLDSMVDVLNRYVG